MNDKTDNSSREAQAARIKTLAQQDAEFRNAFPLPEVNEAKRQPGLRLAQVVQQVMEGYADRPALGQRARELVTDPATGRQSMKLLPRFETITYRDLWARARGIAAEWHHDREHPVTSGDFVCILGFASVDYAAQILASIHLGAVIVPLQTSAAPAQHAAILAETEATLLATGIDYLGSAVEAVLAGHAPHRLVVFDYEPGDDQQREKLESARRQLQQAGCPIVVDTLDNQAQRGASLTPAPLYVAEPGEDPLAWLFYTSGSTGTPKGAMFNESLVIKTWQVEMPVPVITLSFMPMSHLVGNGYMLMSLANGGTSYCSPKSDLSSLFDDLPLARPTMASLVPRVCEMFYQEFLRRVDRRLAGGEQPAEAEAAVKTEMRETLLGGRLLSVGCGSAALAPEIHAFMESMLGMPMSIGYSSTEIGGGIVYVNGRIQRPPVLDYKLADVPELGYFHTDKPYPRGELLVKCDQFMAGYFKRPELTAEKFDADGYYHTGDVMAEIGPDHLEFVDRCNNVIKLSQGEFVAVARLEAVYAQSPLIRQIYIYGTSERAFLLAVVVPTEEGFEQGADNDAVKAAIRKSMHAIAEQARLASYEIPRDFLIETELFSHENGLLSGIGKHLRPNLRDRYRPQLEDVYTRIAQDQIEELRALRTGGADRPTEETVARALRAVLGVAASDVHPEARFSDLGGDSLSALEFSLLLEEIFAVEVSVGLILNPAGNLRQLAGYIDTVRNSGVKRPGFNAVHGKGSTRVQAADLTLDKFIDRDTLAKAATLPLPDASPRTVLLTGATGYLGRFLALAWLERLAKVDGKLILLARGSDPRQAQQRIEDALDTDPELIEHFRALAADHLEVLPADLGLPGLGLDEDTWQRLAGSVDRIVHSGAHVNHLLPYGQLFGANVLGTAELIRLAVTDRRKGFDYVSTLGVSALTCDLIDEDGDIRQSAPACELNDHYANGYNVSKWASEVLLREAHDQCGLPVAVFRPGMILAHSRYAGQLNVPDMFTRLLFSLAVTGVAPATFYAQDLAAGRPVARYEGFNVDFLADVITAIGAEHNSGFQSYNLSSPHEESVSLDDFVDWMIDAGCDIERVERYDQWLPRFETALQALPEAQRQQSLLALIDPYRQPQMAGVGTRLKNERFCAAAKSVGHPIPDVSAALIHKYVEDLKHVGLLS